MVLDNVLFRDSYDTSMDVEIGAESPAFAGPLSRPFFFFFFG